MRSNIASKFYSFAELLNQVTNNLTIPPDQLFSVSKITDMYMELHDFQTSAIAAQEDYSEPIFMIEETEKLMAYFRTMKNPSKILETFFKTCYNYN